MKYLSRNSNRIDSTGFELRRIPEFVTFHGVSIQSEATIEATRQNWDFFNFIGYSNSLSITY